MTAAIQTEQLTRRFRSVTAVDSVDATVEEDIICGLLGRNGAGKTTLLELITAARRPTSGRLRVFGQSPWENAAVLARTCFVRESQKYPDAWSPGQAIKAASRFYPDWNAALAKDLVKAFDLPIKRSIAKLSRGQHSAVGAIIGLASRAPLTIFDEPYLGLDAVARQLFYDALLADYAEHPRTVIVSTHLIDEIAHLLAHVLVIDHGRIVVDSDTESLVGATLAVSGPAATVTRLTSAHTIIRRQDVGGFATITIAGPLDDAEKVWALEQGLDIASVPLQQLVVNAASAAAGIHPGQQQEEIR
jgi:ABC-2 type transport system ATP-binding protein